jgi:two-component system, OmpR family, sensor histidine kinase CpxA
VRSLFLKIFLSFWLAQALFLVLAILVTVTLRPREAAWESLESRVLNRAVTAYVNGGEDGVGRYLSDLQTSQHVRAFLFDDQGKEVSGARPPEWVEHVERGEHPRPPGLLARLGPDRLLRQSTIGPDGRRYTLVLEIPPTAARALFGPGGVPGLAIFIAVLSSGLVCYFLARFMTKPVVRLRTATQKLAAGDLTARAGSSGKAAGGDEIAQLVSDFDSMAERLENLVTAQSRLLNDISHELRSPLARLSVALELARQRSGPEAATALERIALESSRLNEMIGRLLTIARLESGEDGMKKAAIHLEDLIVDVAADAEFEAQSRGCGVRVSVREDLVVTGNAALLRSAIENVVRNAIRYTHEATEIEVGLDRAPDSPMARIRVKDSGPGVADEALDKLFRPFYRIDDARGRQTGGVGLGLAITDRAVRLHGGSVTAANRPEGGLVIEITLPLAAPEVPRRPMGLAHAEHG